MEKEGEGAGSGRWRCLREERAGLRGGGKASLLADFSLHHKLAGKVGNLVAVERLTLLHTCESREEKGLEQVWANYGPGAIGSPYGF